MSESEQAVDDTGCCVPEDQMLAVKDLNMDYPWKGGNKYARVCPECRGRKFCASSYWETRDAQEDSVAYVIKKGEGGGDDEKAIIRPLYRCPYTEEYVDEDPCGEEFLGAPDGEEPMEECPNCGRELLWED